MTPDEYLERVRALLPALRERAVHAEFDSREAERVLVN